MVTNAASTLDPARIRGPSGPPDSPSARAGAPASRPLRAATWLVITLVVLACVVGALVSLDTQSPDLAFAFGSTGAILVLVSMFVAEYRVSGNALDPLCIAAVFLLFLYPIHGLLMRDDGALVAIIGSDSTEWLTRALIVVTVSLPFLRLGYRSRLSARIAGLLPRPRFVVDDDAPTTRSKLVILYVVAIVPRVVALVFGQIFHWEDPERGGNEFQFILSVLINIPVFVTAWFFVQGFRRREKRLVVIGLAMLGVELAWGLLSGSRVRMLMPIVATVAALTYVYRPMRLRTLVIGFTLFVLVLFPFATAFRTAYFGRLDTVRREGIEASTLVDAFSDATTTEADSGKLFDGADGPLEGLAERLHGLTSLALVIRYTPERQDYMLGVPYLLIVPQVLIPRAIWSDKPEIAPFTRVFREKYWGIDPGENTSVAVSQLGDLYVNLHLVGTTLGVFAYGAFMALAFRHLRFGIATPSIVPKIVFSVHLTTFIHVLEGPFDAAIAGFIKSLFVYYIIAWLLQQRGPARPVVSPVGS